MGKTEVTVAAVRAMLDAARQLSAHHRLKGLRDGSLQVLGRGTVIRSSDLERCEQPWQRCQMAFIGHVLHVARAARQPAHFVGAAAALLADIPMYPTPANVETVAPTRPSTSRTDLGVLRWADGYRSRAAAHIRSSAEIPSEYFIEAGGRVFLRPLENAVWCAGRLDPLTAFQICSTVAQRIGGFDRDDPIGSRQRERAVKDQMLGVLSGHPGWAHDIRRARWIIENLDAGCESPGEQRVVFELRSRGVVGVITQQKIQTKRGVRYADVSIDGCGVLGEYDGIPKDGVTQEEWLTARDERTERDAELSHLGIGVLHITNRTVADGDRMLADFYAKARRSSVIDPALALPPPRRARRGVRRGGGRGGVRGRR